MMNTIEFEPDYQKRILHINFTAPTKLQSRKDVLALRSKWTEALTSWHSPYKAIINCENLSIEDTEEVAQALKTMLAFLKGFFLKKAEGFHHRPDQGHQLLPFTVHENRDDCDGAKPKASKDATDLRSRLAIENHFPQQTVELIIEHTVNISSLKELQILRSKLTNNLMQWHSGWNLLIDCQHFTIHEDLFEEWEKMARFFKGFFLKDVIGYSPASAGQQYPFPVFRSRHKAAAKLEQESLSSGDTANCQTRKPAQP